MITLYQQNSRKKVIQITRVGSLVAARPGLTVEQGSIAGINRTKSMSV